jgi:hypothetical protein
VPSAAERHQAGDLDAPDAFGRGQDDPDAGVVVEQDLAVAPARADGTSPAVPDRDDRGELAGPGRACVPQGHQFGARSAGEVVEVDPAVHRAVDSAHGGAHRMDAVFAVGVGIHDRAGELDQLHVFRGELPVRHVHGSPGYRPALAMRRH